MNKSPDFWPRLVAVARPAPENDGETSAPVGFATRVVALALERGAERAWSRLVEQFAWRALGLAAGVALVSAAWNFVPAQQALESDSAFEQDPVALVLDFSR